MKGCSPHHHKPNQHAFPALRWSEQIITLQNPTEETLELIPAVSNTNNFFLERDNERPILLRPHTSLEIPLHFMPSTLGQGDHLAKIIFLSQQVCELAVTLWCMRFSLCVYTLPPL